MAAPEHDWYLADWLATMDKNQNWLTTKLELHKNTAHRLYTGKQPYRRDFVNLIAAELGIEPFELLMHPDDAFRMRRLRGAVLAEIESRAITKSPAVAAEASAPTPAPARRKA